MSARPAKRYLDRSHPEPDSGAFGPEPERLDLCPDRQAREQVPEFMRDHACRRRQQDYAVQLPAPGRLPGTPAIVQQQRQHCDNPHEQGDRPAGEVERLLQHTGIMAPFECL